MAGRYRHGKCKLLAVLKYDLGHFSRQERRDARERLRLAENPAAIRVPVFRNPEFRERLLQHKTLSGELDKGDVVADTSA